MLRPLLPAVVLFCLATGLAAQEPAKDADDKQAQPATTAARSRPRVRFGGFTVGAGYMHTAGRYPYYGAYPGYWGYDPFFYGTWFHPGYFYGFAYQPAMGQLKVRADRDAWIFLDGALAGRADKLRSMWLEPGVYNLEIRTADRTASRRIYVLSGKTMHVTPRMMEEQP